MRCAISALHKANWLPCLAVEAFPPVTRSEAKVTTVEVLVVDSSLETREIVPPYANDS